jgi:hypothetical protein
MDTTARSLRHSSRESEHFPAEPWVSLRSLVYLGWTFLRIYSPIVRHVHCTREGGLDNKIDSAKAA